MPDVEVTVGPSVVLDVKAVADGERGEQGIGIIILDAGQSVPVGTPAGTRILRRP